MLVIFTRRISNVALRNWKLKMEKKMGTRLQYCNSKDYGVSKLVRCKKLYMQCHHRQQNTGKNHKDLKTVIRSNKSNCPAELTLTTHKRHHGYLIEAMLQHNHNDTISVADPLSQYWRKPNQDLFKQGHSPSSAHLEYETNLMYRISLITPRPCLVRALE